METVVDEEAKVKDNFTEINGTTISPPKTTSPSGMWILSFTTLFGLSAAMDTVEEKTLAMIKPDGVSGNYTDVKKSISDSGSNITQTSAQRGYGKKFLRGACCKELFSQALYNT